MSGVNSQAYAKLDEMSPIRLLQNYFIRLEFFRDGSWTP